MQRVADLEACLVAAEARLDSVGAELGSTLGKLQAAKESIYDLQTVNAALAGHIYFLQQSKKE